MTKDLSIPKVSVILPAYNCEEFIADAIDSILTQTMQDFELIIIDNASNDMTASILRNRASHDRRIRLERDESRPGLSHVINYGLGMARGNFIARMDGDDVCHPRRLEHQVTLLERIPSIDVVGTLSWAVQEGMRYAKLLVRPETDWQVRFALLFNCVISHPTVMFRRALVERYKPLYSQEYRYAEDYELWARLSGCVSYYNLQMPLLRYRIHKDQISSLRSSLQADEANAVSNILIKQMTDDPLPSWADKQRVFIALNGYLLDRSIKCFAQLDAPLRIWCVMLLESFVKIHRCDDELLLSLLRKLQDLSR